jgi:hypothetical protein
MKKSRLSDDEIRSHLLIKCCWFLYIGVHIEMKNEVVCDKLKSIFPENVLK